MSETADVRVLDVQRARRKARAREALVAYLRLLAECLQDEADMLNDDPDRAEEMLRRFRREVIEMSLGDAPVDALLDRAQSRRRPSPPE
jgi:hypothetical protein